MNQPKKGTDIPLGTKILIKDNYFYFGVVKAYVLPQDDSVMIQDPKSYNRNLKEISLEKIQLLDPKMEEEFKELFKSVSKEIKSKLDMVNTILNDVINLSETHGIPFYSNVSQISQSYVPRTFKSKFQTLDPEVVYELTGAYTDLDNYGGWQHSAVC